MISSMSFAALPWEFSIAWIADKESENITVSVGVELPLSNCCIRVSRVFWIAISQPRSWSSMIHMVLKGVLVPLLMVSLSQIHNLVLLESGCSLPIVLLPLGKMFFIPLFWCPFFLLVGSKSVDP